MAVKTEKELSEDQRAHWLKAVAAIELRNFGYAISLLQGILKQEPQFLTGRQLLRRTEVTRFKAAKKKFFNVSTASVAVMKAQREMRKDAKRAVELIEKILENEPYNKQANLALKEAAVAAGWPVCCRVRFRDSSRSTPPRASHPSSFRAADIARRERARYQTA